MAGKKNHKKTSKKIKRPPTSRRRTSGGGRGGRRPGAGRPTLIADGQTVGFRLPAEQVAWLDEEADRAGCSRSEIVRILIDAAMNGGV